MNDITNMKAETGEVNPSVATGDGAGLPARTVEVVTLEIVTLKRQAGRVLAGYAIEIGRRLAEVKEMLPHGEWGKYLRERVEYSQSTAENFMKLFQEYGVDQQSLFGAEAKSQTIGNLPYSKALALLALPADEREAFAEENDAETMSTRELQAALRAKEEAEVQAKTAEEARATMEQSVKVVNANMAAAREEVDVARKAQVEAETRAEELEAKIKELEDCEDEADVTASSAEDARAADPAELDKAREEGRLEAEKTLLEKLDANQREKAEAVEKLRKELKTAKDAAREAKEAGKGKEEALLKARKEAERLKKELAAASSKYVTVFEVGFKNTQTDFTVMLDQLAALKKAGDRENYNKLVGAMGALLEALRGQVPERVGGMKDG